MLKKLFEGYSFGDLLLSLAFMFVLIFGGACAVKAVSASGNVTYCYISSINNGQGAWVMGHRDWRPDLWITQKPTPEEAKVAMDRLCPLRNSQ